jgi:hypothetical protein
LPPSGVLQCAPDDGVGVIELLDTGGADQQLVLFSA